MMNELTFHPDDDLHYNTNLNLFDRRGIFPFNFALTSG